MKLLCKNCLNTYSIVPGKYYKIYHDKIQYVYFDYYLFNDIKKRVWFTTNKNSNWYIWNYFYTHQEERKMKLEKLYETTL